MNPSPAAMEATLKPQVLETLEVIARNYEELADLQDRRMSATLNEDGRFSKADEALYQQVRTRIVALVNDLHCTPPHRRWSTSRRLLNRGS